MTDDDRPPEFDAWVRQRGASLLRFAYLVTRDHNRAEEAVQDALVAAYSHWARITRNGDPEAYVRRSIVNADISRWRRFFRRETPISDATLFETGPDGQASDHAGDHAEQDAVWTLCASLPTRQRAAVVLRYYEGLPDVAIAEISPLAGAEARAVSSALSGAIKYESGPEAGNCTNAGDRTFELHVRGTRGSEAVTVRYSFCSRWVTAATLDQQGGFATRTNLARLIRTGVHKPPGSSDPPAGSPSPPAR